MDVRSAEEEGARRGRLLPIVEAGRSHPYRVVVVALAIEVALLTLIGSVSETRSVYGLPGSVASLTAVVVGALAGPASGALTALAAGGVFYWVVADVGEKSTPQAAALSIALWVAAGVISGLLAGALREREVRRMEGVARLAEAEAAHAAEREVSALHAALENGLLPARPPRHDRLRVVTTYKPGEQRLLLGGDFLDALVCSDGGLALVIGDVIGHGPEAAALGARLRAAWLGLTLGGASLAAVAGSLNQLVLLSGEEGLATSCLVRLDGLGESAEFLSAGHPRPLLVTGEATTVELPPNLPFGFLEDIEYASVRLELPEQWALFLYTDGLTEGRGHGDGRRPYDEKLLRDDLPRRLPLTQASVSAMVAEIEHANGGGLEDDVAVVAVTRR